MFLFDYEVSRFISILNLILVICVIFWGRNRSSRSTVMWVMVVSSFPIIGFIAYLLIGADTRRTNMFRLKESQDDIIREMTAQQVEDVVAYLMTLKE